MVESLAFLLEREEYFFRLLIKTALSLIKKEFFWKVLYEKDKDYLYSRPC